MSKFLYILFLCSLCFTSSVAATNKETVANDAYHTSDYHRAVRLYTEALKKGASAEVYYNLGNAYYRIDDVPKALLFYEKALKMSPMDRDILHNINIARAKTVDKFPPESELFFVQWYRSMQGMTTIDGWAYMAMISFILALLLFLAYLFMDNLLVRRMAFYSSVVLLLFFVMGNVFAMQRKAFLERHDTAIVMSPVVTVKNSPTTGAADACVIHEGTKVRITDHDMKDWKGIRLSDGREGWVKNKDIEEI